MSIQKKEIEKISTVCEMCGIDMKVIIVLQIENKNGENKTRACPGCALTSKAYCRKHKMPLVRFGENPRLICSRCVEDEMRKREKAIERVVEFLKKKLSSKVFSLLLYKAGLESRIFDMSVNFCIIKRIVIVSMQKNIGLYSVVLEICKNQSIDIIYP